MTSPARILIVEDQYFVALDCEMQLRAAGFECVGSTTTAAGAVNMAEGENPDLIIMDIRLAGGSDGVQAALYIHEHFGIRCIFASGHADANLRQQAAPARPLGWLDKPYDSDRLIWMVRDALQQLQDEREPAASVPEVSASFSGIGSSIGPTEGRGGTRSTGQH